MQHLAGLKQYLATKLPKLTEDKTNLFIVNGGFQEGYLNYTARIFLMDCRGDPIMILATIKKWLRDNDRHLDTSGKEIELTFSSEIIDTQTYDLEIDFPQRDKININADGYNICKQRVWDDQLGFVQR